MIQPQRPKKSATSGKSERSGKADIEKADGPMDVPPEALPENDVLPPRTAKLAGHRGLATQPAACREARAAKARGRKARAEEPSPDKAAAEKPVFIIPGERSITISSDDPEALEQIERLLRVLSQPRGPIGRNYAVYPLRNANAANVASILQNFFRPQSGRFFRTNQVMIVPDERLNAIIAYAGRADRTTIENLLEVLDSSEIPQPLASDRLHFIPVENTTAQRMAQVLQDLYGTQAGTISVEDNTNSLIVMGAPTLVEHMQQIVAKLDEAAGAESDRTVEIISLRNSNTDRVQAALDIVLRTRLPTAATTTPRAARPGAAGLGQRGAPPTAPRTPRRPRGEGPGRPSGPRRALPSGGLPSHPPARVPGRPSRSRPVQAQRRVRGRQSRPSPGPRRRPRRAETGSPHHAAAHAARRDRSHSTATSGRSQAASAPAAPIGPTRAGAP